VTVLRLISLFVAICVGLPFSSFAADYVPGEIIVKMKSSASTSSKHQFIGKAALDHKMSLKRSWSRFNLHQFSLKTGQSVDAAVDAMRADPDVEYAEPNYLFTKQSVGIEGEAFSASDPQGEAVGKFNSEGFGQTFSDSMNVAETWEELSDNSNVPIVAVIDSGVDYNHYVFVDSDAIWENEDEIPNNGIDDDGNGYIDDVRGWNFAYGNNDPMDDDNHGTHVAGIVLGMTQNILANSVEPARLKIMPLKFLDDAGSGSTSDAIEAINYALNNGATILNNSWGGSSYSQALEDAIVSTYNSKAAFIAAAGNATNNNDSSPTYPASYSVPNVISIAATRSDDDLAYFSNYGASSVHVGSPGASIISTLPNDSFGYSSGTSMAAPFVAGLTALMAIENPEINGFQAREIIFNQTDTISSLSGKVASAGRIDALSTVTYVQGNPIGLDQPAYSENSTRSLASEATQASGGCGLVKSVWNKTKGGRGTGSLGGSSLMLGLLFAPLLIILGLKIRRQANSPEARRAHKRYNVNSEVKISVGDRQFVASMSSISLGGARVDTDAMLESGGIVTMSIESPDGESQIEVQGKVVWSEEKKAYGLAFCDAKSSTLDAISQITQKLVKAS